MEYFKTSLAKYFNQHDEWLYFTLVLIFSLYQLEHHYWPQYISHIISNSSYLAPLIIFKAFQNKITARFSIKHYQLFRFSCFFVYPLLVFLSLNSFNLPENFSLKSPGIILLLGIGVELILVINQMLSGKRLIKFVPKNVGLNQLILFFLAFISIYAALLISSDLSLWAKSNSIPSTINFSEIAEHPLTTISLAFQLFCLFFCGYIFYWFNYHVLVKSVLAKRGMLIYLCAVISIVVLLYPILIELYLLFPINSMGEPIIPAVKADAFDWHNGRVFLAVMLLSLPVILVMQWHKKSSQFNLLEKENIQTELRLLKQQIDPHFFFNTLNNLYALCRKKSEQAPEVVLQLAELMQYVVYRGQERSVLIEEDISYINDYINLQSIRLRNKLSLKTEVTLDDKQSVISPLLLIILVENAFKHGIELATQDCYLHIEITVKDQQLTFICQNSIEQETTLGQESMLGKQSSKTIEEGIGLANLKRRLTLIYPDNYQLSLTHQSNKFTAQLCINLNGATFINSLETAND
ncbi:MAG: histidine kinase [Colwellia sp.]|nr:histidine kinase [Colwellia sp.]